MYSMSKILEMAAPEPPPSEIAAGPDAAQRPLGPVQSEAQRLTAADAAAVASGADPQFRAADTPPPPTAAQIAAAAAEDADLVLLNPPEGAESSKPRKTRSLAEDSARKRRASALWGWPVRRFLT